MKKASIILVIGLFAVCLFTGCGNQPKQAVAEAKAAEAGALVVAVKDTQIDPVSPVSTPVYEETQKDDEAAVSETEGKSEKESEAPVSNTTQEDSSGAFIGGWLVTDQNGRSIPKPEINVELDFNKDGTIDSEDYKVSGMDKTDFAAKMVENGNVGTKGEAEMVISGELAVMCGVIH